MVCVAGNFGTLIGDGMPGWCDNFGVRAESP